MKQALHCCGEMESFITHGEVAIRFIPKFREYGISYLDGGTSYQEIYFCPWCGSKLPNSLRREWFQIIEDNDLEPDSNNIPKELLSELWYSNKK